MEHGSGFVYHMILCSIARVSGLNDKRHRKRFMQAQRVIDSGDIRECSNAKPRH